ncbi:hypothetical protein MAP00_008873 [Monascus purpureus]|nr:hypothetical protein MAP00_008873 [Monascus purpureus]
MADDGMSIIPYHSSPQLDVVLRHNDSVVVLDRDSQQLVLQNTAHSDGNLELADCPYCHRPMHDGSRRESHHAGSGVQAEFVNPNYFRMLHNSLPSSPQSSCSHSPHRRLAQSAIGDGSTGDLGRPGDGPSTHGISSAAFSQNYFKKFFVEESELGKGGKGVVLLVRHVLDGVSLGYYACKRVPVGDDHEWLEKVLGEVQLLQHLSHQNLVSYRHVWLENVKISTFGPSVPCAFILQQYCNAGDLHKYVCGQVQTSVTTQQLKERLRRRSKGEPEPRNDLAGPRRLQLEEIYSFFKDITSGLRYLHANGYIHRDLKPSNCLLHQTSDGIRVLVSDFGEVQSQDSIRKSTGSTGTVSYCAPEVLQPAYPDGPLGNFTFKSDIFSLGMILYFLCFAQLPYHNADIIEEENEDLEKLREEIANWNGLDDVYSIRADLPEKLYAFLQQLLSIDPSQRPSADDVLNGIQAGVNGNENFHFKRSNSVGSDLHSSSRVKFYEGSTSPSVSRPPLSPATTRLSRSPVALRRGSIFDTNGARASQTPTDGEISGISYAVPPERNLIVRRGFSKTPPLSSARGEHRDERQFENGNVERQQPLLPLPPSNQTPVGVRRAISVWVPSLPLMQLGLFLLKVVSSLQPCAPLATNPWILYPLLLLAAVNVRTRSIKIQVIALSVHLLTVGISIRLGVLCTWNHPRTTAYGI